MGVDDVDVGVVEVANFGAFVLCVVVVEAEGADVGMPDMGVALILEIGKKCDE